MCIVLLLPLTTSAQEYGELDTKFRFHLFRSDTDPVGLVIALVSTSEYPCDGYTLRTNVTHRRDTVTVSILGMLRPDPCYATMGKATGTAFLGNKVGGRYILRIYYRGVMDLYRLSLEENERLLMPIKTSFTTEKPPDTYEE